MTFPGQDGLYLPPSWEYPTRPESVPSAIQQREALTANLLNLREVGAYFTEATSTGQSWPTTNPVQSRTTLRKLFEIAALPNATTLNVPHGITVNGTFRLTALYGAASDPSANVYLPLPYVTNPVTDQIRLALTATNVVIQTWADYSAYSAFVVVEWLPV